MPLGDIQGAVPDLPVTHAVILAPGKIKSQEVDFYLFLPFFQNLNCFNLKNPEKLKTVSRSPRYTRPYSRSR